MSPSTTDTPADASTEDTGSFVAGPTPGEAPLDVVASRGGPPPYVSDQIAAAGRIEEELREAGHHVRFLTADDGRTRIELEDRDGNAVRALSVAEVLELAAGRPLE